MIRFSLSRVKKEPLELVGNEPAEWLEIEPSELLTITAPVHYALLAQAVSGGVLVRGTIGTSLSGICGRCLNAVRRNVETSGVCLFYALPEGDELDITEDLRAEMLLELPMNLLCSDECKGLCPHCGKNLNDGACACRDDKEPDIRWKALDRWKP